MLKLKILISMGALLTASFITINPSLATYRIETDNTSVNIPIRQPSKGDHFNQSEKDLRKQVAQETLLASEYGYKNTDPNIINSSIKMPLAHSKVFIYKPQDGHAKGFIETKDWRAFEKDTNYEFMRDLVHKPNHEYETEIQVTGEDTIVAGLRLKEEGYNPACLNMANGTRVGGGFLSGASAQEESLMYRTNYYKSLESIYNNHKSKGNAPYNFLPETGIIYTPNVSVFRKTESEGFEFMEAPQTLSFFASDAYNLNKEMSSGKHQMGNLKINFAEKGYNSYKSLRNNQEYIEGTKTKIRMQLAVMYKMGHDSLVLSGFGCGAFENNWELMSDLYKEAITEDFKGCFKKIVFGIANPQDPYKMSVNPNNDTSSYFSRLATSSKILPQQEAQITEEQENKADAPRLLTPAAFNEEWFNKEPKKKVDSDDWFNKEPKKKTIIKLSPSQKS